MSIIGLSAGRVTPTVAAILTEAFRRTGTAAPTQVALDRARDFWLEEVLREIADEKRWHALEETLVIIPQAYGHLYDVSPLTRILRVRFYDGDVRGTAAGGTITTITLAQTVTADLFGRKIFLTGGTGAGQGNRILGGSGAVATMEQDWATTPDTTTTYLIPNLEVPVYGPAPNMPHLGIGASNIITHWDWYEGKLQLWPPLNRSTYAVELDGIIDVNVFDTVADDGVTLTRLLREWRRALVYGLMIRIFEDDDDERAVLYEPKFEKAKLQLKQSDARARRSIGPIAMMSPGGLPRR